jgi:hypothetical protein
MAKVIKVYDYEGSVVDYPVPDDNWPGPTVTFAHGFVEVEADLWLNANDIKRIRIVEQP